MRVSTQELFRQGVSQIQEKQSNLARLQAQISSGRRLLTPADDPGAAARVLDLAHAQAAITQYQTNADMASQRLTQEESVLATATNTIQRIRELAIQARGPNVGDNDRKFIAAEVRERLQELIGIGNTVDGNGDYLFAGHSVRTLPFLQQAASGQVIFNADQGSRLIEVSPGRTIADSDSGDAVLMGIRNGNGTFVTSADGANTGTGIIVPGGLSNPAAYIPDNLSIVFTSATTFDVIDNTTATTLLAAQTYGAGSAITVNGVSVSIDGIPTAGDRFHIDPSANQSAFKTVNDFASALQTSIGSPASQARFANAVNRTLTDLDQVLEKFLEVRSSIGARLKAIDTQKNVNDDLHAQLTTLRSSLEDVDVVQAASDLNLQLTTLQASEQAFTRTQQLNLFNFLN